jgi:dTMP kinase
VSGEHHRMRGRFITFEGGDGAGKTTQAVKLEAWLRERGHEVVRTREPGGTALGQGLRELLLHGAEPVDPRTEALLYAADRAQHVAQIVRPALKRGAIVVQDRYIDSSLAYQGAGRVLAIDEVRRLSTWASGGLQPDVTVLLDVSPERGVARRVAAGNVADRLEREASDFHARVREAFLQLARAEPDRFFTLDAHAPIDLLHASIIQRVATILE